VNIYGRIRVTASSYAYLKSLV